MLSALHRRRGCVGGTMGSSTIEKEGSSWGNYGFPHDLATLCALGVWRSLVARSVRVGEVPSSNLGTPIGVGEPVVSPRAPSFSLWSRVALCQAYGRVNRPPAVACVDYLVGSLVVGETDVAQGAGT